MKTLSLLSFTFFIGCTTLSRNDYASALLANIEKLEFSFDREQVLAIMGEPSERLQRQEDETWIYRNADKFQTAALGFSGKSGRLKGKMLILFEKDRLANPDEAKKHFKDVSFEIVEPPWENPHAGPNQLFYISRQKGIKLIYSTSHNLFESISWWDVRSPPPPLPKSKTPYKL